jgi:hypothetical protein
VLAYYAWTCIGFFEGSRWRNAARTGVAIVTIVFIEAMSILALIAFWVAWFATPPG